MAMQKCDNCSAPLELAEIGSIQRCKYCGIENRILEPQTTSSPDTPVKSKLAAIIIFTAFAVSLLIGFVISFLTIKVEKEKEQKNSVQQTAEQQILNSIENLTKIPIPSTKGLLAPSEISKLGIGWTKIDHSGMSGDFSNFDILENFSFAQKVAQNWSTDVQIDSIYIDGVKLDGTIDLSAKDDWDVDYRFYSPTHRQTAISMAAVSEDKISSELRIQFEAGNMSALLSDRPLWILKKETPKEAFTPSCNSKQILEEAQKSKKFEKSPFYDVTLQHIDSHYRSSKGYWRWVVSCEGCSSIIIKEGTCKLK